MKSLYINNKKVILDNTYFPFTYKISDLEEVNIIGVPQSKTVEIKRLPENDEIFGYIGEIHRSTFNFTGDNLVGSSFNQTKKAYYELFQDSELVSSGQVQVTGVNEENYEITLYDTLIDLLEQFEGNSDTDKGYLSSMDIIKYNNTSFSMQTNALNVHNLNNDSVDVVPVVNITEFETSGSEIRCLDSVTSLPINATLPDEFTPIQARTLKNYEVEYAVPINTVIRSINKYKLDDTINYNLLKGTTDEWTNSIILNGEAYLSSDITKEQLGLEIGKTYTVSLTGKNFSSGQYCIGLEINNSGTINTIYGNVVPNNTRNFINFTVGDLFTSMRIIVDTTIGGKNYVVNGKPERSFGASVISNLGFSPGQQITLSLYGKFSGLATSSLTIIIYNGGSTNYDGTSLMRIDINNSEYTKYERTITLPASLSNLRLVGYIGGLGVGTGYAKLIKCEVGNKATDFEVQSQIDYKELKIEEGIIPTEWILNKEEEGYGFNYIQVEEGLNTLFDEVHLNCGKPKINEADIVTESFIIDAMPTSLFNNTLGLTNKQFYKDFNSNSINYGKKNGKYYLEIPISISITRYNDFLYNNIITQFNGYTYANISAPTYTQVVYGTKIGELFVDTKIVCWNGSNRKFETLAIRNQINMIYGQNTSISINGSNKVTGALIDTKLILEFDFYPEFLSLSGIVSTIGFDYKDLLSNTKFFNVGPYPLLNFSISYNQGSGLFTQLDLRTNDTFTGKEILPKVPIKDFIINLCKFYNLDIVNSNNSLLIRRKKYFKTNEVLRIAKLNSVDVNLFNFNKLILTTDVTSNSLIDTYNKNTKQVYGQKGINTGYAIKPNSKKVNIPIGVPALIVDTNKLAYDSFGNYFNAGRSRGMYGVTEGFEDKLIFGYINRITNDPIYITNDTYYEGGMWSSAEPNNHPTEIKFKMNNQRLFYNSNSFTFNTNPSPYGQSVMLGNFNTISPYKFDSNGLIVESLEMNKPKYNYAGITDEKYDETVTLYDRYHKKMLEDRYNVDTNIIDVDIYMDSMPNIYAIYNIKGTNYIISELSEYDPSTDGEIFEGIKLLKVNNVYNYGVSDYYNVEITPKLTFNGNIVLLASKLLGYNYNTYGSSQPTSDLFKLLTTNYFNNSLLNITYDNDLDVTYVTQTNRTTFEVTPGYINKFKIGNTYFNYLSDYTQQQYLLENDESFQLIDEAGSGVFNQQSLNQPLYLRSGNKIITEAGIYDPIKTNLECIQSGGLYYWLISAECILKLNNSTQSLSSISKFKFDNISIEAKEHPDDIDYTTFTWGHSDLLDVNYTYFSDGSLKFTFKAMLFQGSSFSGTLVDNVRDMWVVPYPDSDYSVKISIDGTYNDYIDAENTDVINFGDVGSNLSYILDDFTGNNETLTTITATNYEVAYNYNK